MKRCLSLTFGAAIGAAFALTAMLSPAAAQTPRSFPQSALRGEMVVVAPPDITMNGQPARLSPGTRIRGQNNMIVLSGGLVAQPLAVNYTLESGGLIKDVWLLRPEEQARAPWPKKPEESQAWSFNVLEQRWTKP